MTDIDKQVRMHQDAILASYNAAFVEQPLSDAVQAAFFANPRHQFVDRYRLEGGDRWFAVAEGELGFHLSHIYRDRWLIIQGDDDEHISSTLSQPTLVLLMLNLLEMKPGLKVLEIGAASGWNAAMLGTLAGANGTVITCDIDPTLCQSATSALRRSDSHNVRVECLDGALAIGREHPLDRIIFTAGTYDLPRSIYESVAEEGIVVCVIKNLGGGDTLYKLRKSDGALRSEFAMPCGFIEMKGELSSEPFQPVPFARFGYAIGTPSTSRPFWWGGKGLHNVRWRQMGFRAYLSIVDDRFCVVSTSPEAKPDINGKSIEFGIYDAPTQSLAITLNEQLLGFGGEVACKAFGDHVRNWGDAGMPTVASFQFEARPVGAPPPRQKNLILRRRTQSDFYYYSD